MTEIAVTNPDRPDLPPLRRYRAIRAIALGLIAGGLLLLGSCTSEREKVDRVSVDLTEIRQRDTLRAITTYSSTSYFVYRGQPMGF
ncbi:MAG: hypothetical protein KKA81_16510, partial [Bacteroidetes bacterium]|nr:hypothetical protein [Bacteroidota bacterium]